MQDRAGTFGEDFEVGPADEDDALVLCEHGEPRLYVFSGRQIVTAERIEVLALTVDLRLAGHLPAKEVVEAVLDAGGIPVLSWAPGKWFFKRSGTVRELIDSFRPGQVLIGDTTLRPTVWPEPLLMRLAVRRGFTVVAGSDPLPFSGEEKYMGTYASIMEGPFDPGKPVTSIRKVMTAPDAVIAMAGKRCGLLEALNRLKRMQAT